MTNSRTTVKTVTFTRPFKFRDMDEERPAGPYEVETDEEMIEPLSFAAYRRTALWIRLPQRPGGDGSQVVRIDQDELDEALGPDEGAKPSVPPSPRSA